MRDILKRCLAGMMAMLLVLTSFTTYVQADEGTEDVPEPVTYKVELVNDEVSTLKFLDKEESSASFEAGSEVSFSVSLKEGYSLEKVEAKTGETEIEVVASENSYSFKMPEGAVGVKALYQEEQQEVPEEVKQQPEEQKTRMLMSPRVGSITTITSSKGFHESAYNVGVGKFTVTGVDGVSHFAFCACHELRLPATGMQMNTVVSNNSNLRKVLFYGNGGPGDRGYSYTQTSIAVSVANGHRDTDYTGETEHALGAPMVQAVAGLPDPGSAFIVYYAYSTDSGAQDLVYWTYNPEGYLTLTKSSANPSLTANNSCYSLEGAEYSVYKDAACTQYVNKLITKADGTANTLTLNAGTYYVKETKAPKGYEMDSKVHTVSVTSSNTAILKVTDTPADDPINILLGKYDGDKTYNGQANLPQGSASLEGARFTVKFYGGQYSSESELSGKTPLRTWVFETNKNGFIRFGKEDLVSGDEFWTDASGNITLPYGTATIQETKAPEGYHINSELFIRQINDDTTASGSVFTYNMPKVKETVIKGGIKITKFGTDPDDESNLKTPLENVKFVLKCKDSNDTFTLITDKNGEASLSGIPYGTYEVTEEDTPKGYQGCKTFEITIDEEGEVLTYLIENKLIRAAISVVKTDAETGKAIPVSGTTFRILDADKNPISMRITYPSNQVVTEFKTDENGAFTLPERLKTGTYYLEELAAPSGYLKGELLSFTVEKGYDWSEPMTIQYADENAMGTISLKKVSSVDESPIKGTEFSVTAAEDIITPDGTVRASKGTVVDTMVTGEDGTATSKKLYLGKYEVKEAKQSAGFVLAEDVYEVELKYKDQNTAVVTEDVGTIKNVPTEITLTKYKKDTDVVLEGVTFSIWPKGTDEVTDYTTNKDGVINVKYLKGGTTYCVQEKATLPGYVPNTEIIEIVVDENGLVDGKTHYEFTVENDYTQLIGTTALDSDTNTHGSKADEEVTIIDTVEFKNLVVGEEYTVKGKIMDQTTGEPLLVDGKEVTAETIFTAEEADGTVDVIFTFDGSALAGKTIVVFEDAYTQGVLIATHADINDEGQTIYFPEIGTTALDGENGTHNTMAKEEAIIVDTVEYKNLIVGTEYKVTGILMDKETGEPLLVDGKEVTAETIFTAETVDGAVDITFKFDASALAGKTLVAFETVTVDEKEVAVHADINDEDQTIYIPEIGTTAIDKENGTHNSMADEEVTIVDTVEYKNLIPGKEYSVKGVLMDKETGKKLFGPLGDTEVTKLFVPEKADGEVEIEFTFNASMLAGKTVVVFETVYIDMKEVAVHADINDEGQTIYFPEIGTTALDGENGTQNTMADGEAVIVDTVEYKNLIVGTEYKVSGVLMDKETGEPLLVDGKEVTAETIFTAETVDGTVDITFKFDASALAGKTLVAFETVTVDGKEVGVHADINDEDQTIYIPKIGTTAKDKDTNSNKAVPKKKSTIIDTVEYTNLIAGKEYTVKGILMIQSTGEPLLVDGKEVTAETTFVPEEAAGTVDVIFTFDSSALNKVSVVVFEEIYLGEDLVGVHADINDKGQTITYKIGTIKTKIPGDFFTGVRTGDAAPIAMLGMMLLASFTAIVFIIKKRRGVSHEE